jgi:hypothetical protein
MPSELVSGAISTLLRQRKWSTGGADYAREVARELGLEHCFVAFLPKPTIMLDDQAPAEWRLCRHVHPFNIDSIET